MATNTFTTDTQEKKVGFRAGLNIPSIRLAFAERKASKYISLLLLITILGIVYIANTYKAEKLHMRVTQLNKETKRLRTLYVNKKYNHMMLINENSIIDKVSSRGLKKNDDQLIQID